MAYFSNGTEGMILDEQCLECRVGAVEGLFCPVMFVQVEYNYKQLDDKGKRTMISELLNRLVNEKGECQMKMAIDKALAGQDIGSINGEPDTCRRMLDQL